MAATNADVISAQMEKVRPVLQDWYETSSKISSKIKKQSEAHKVSAWVYPGTTTQAGFRIPVGIYRGGDFGTFDYNGGDLGGGSSMNIQAMTLGYYPTKLGFELTTLEIEATASNEQSVVNVFRKQIGDAMKEMQVYEDISFHQDGTGVIANGDGLTTPTGTTVYTLEPNFGPQRLRLNMTVDVYNAALTVKKSSGTVRVSAINWIAKQVTLTGTVTSPLSDDAIAIAGMSATLAVGSYENGLYTFNNSATSGTTLGINRATYSEIVSPNINAGGPLVPAMGLALKDQMTQRRDDEVLDGLWGIIHMSQRAAIYLTGIAISEWMRKPSEKMIDIVPEGSDYKGTVQWCEVEHFISKRQDRSRVDWINSKIWGRVMIHDLKFYEVEGRRIFENRGSNGNVYAGCRFYLVRAENKYSSDGGSGGFISSLSLPPTY